MIESFAPALGPPNQSTVFADVFNVAFFAGFVAIVAAVESRLLDKGVADVIVTYETQRLGYSLSRRVTLGALVFTGEFLVSFVQRPRIDELSPNRARQ